MGGNPEKGSLAQCGQGRDGGWTEASQMTEDGGGCWVLRQHVRSALHRRELQSTGSTQADQEAAPVCQATAHSDILKVFSSPSSCLPQQLHHCSQLSPSTRGWPGGSCTWLPAVWL